MPALINGCWKMDTPTHCCVKLPPPLTATKVVIIRRTLEAMLGLRDSSYGDSVMTFPLPHTLQLLTGITGTPHTAWKSRATSTPPPPPLSWIRDLAHGVLSLTF